MPVNRNQILRYKVIDRCLRDLSRQYCVADLQEAVNAELRKYDLKPISRRTIQLDLQVLQSEPYNAELDIELASAHCYRYADTSFRLEVMQLLPADLDALTRTIALLQEYGGQNDVHPLQYQWLLIILQAIASDMDLQAVEQYVSFEHNNVFAGNAHFATLLESVLNHRPIIVRYQPYGREASERYLHPYHLKQFNNRWFLFAKEDCQQGITNLALDRIHSIRPWRHQFEPSEIDFTTYFDDMIGVSRNYEKTIEQVVIRIVNSRYPYVQTKPFSERQRIVSHDDSHHVIAFPIHINNELVAELLSFGADIEVLKPQSLRERIRDILEQANLQYSTAQKPCATKQ